MPIPINSQEAWRSGPALARALVNDPAVLLTDEPLANRDGLTRISMQEELITLWQQQGFTAFMLTHDIDEVLYLAGRDLVLSRVRRTAWQRSPSTYRTRAIEAPRNLPLCAAEY